MMMWIVTLRTCGLRLNETITDVNAITTGNVQGSTGATGVTGAIGRNWGKQLELREYRVIA
jgi:hypothetical protein